MMKKRVFLSLVMNALNTVWWQLFIEIFFTKLLRLVTNENDEIYQIKNNYQLFKLFELLNVKRQFILFKKIIFSVENIKKS